MPKTQNQIEKKWDRGIIHFYIPREFREIYSTFIELLDDDEDDAEVCVEEFPELVKSVPNVPATTMNYKKVLENVSD